MKQLIYCDYERVTDMFTYCSDDGLRHSWIDHIVCSMPVNNLNESVYVDTNSGSEHEKGPDRRL